MATLPRRRPPPYYGADRSRIPKIFPDHEVVVYRQARWSLFFSRFNLVFCYRPGSRNGKADALSRRPDLEAVHSHPTASPMFRDEAFPDPVPVPDPVPAVIRSTNNAGLTSPDFYGRLVQATSKDDYAQSKIRTLSPDSDFTYVG